MAGDHNQDNNRIYSSSLQQGNNNNSLVIDSEVLFIHDSNLHRMKPEIMNNGTRAEKIFCPTIRNNLDLLFDNVTVKMSPKQVFIQVGTNDLHHADVDIDDLLARMKNLCLKIRTKLNNPEIVVSSIFPRRDHMDRVELLNNALM